MKYGTVLLLCLALGCGDDGSSNNANNGNNANNMNNGNNANNTNNGNNANNDMFCEGLAPSDPTDSGVDDSRFIFDFLVPDGWTPLATGEVPSVPSYTIGRDVGNQASLKEFAYELNQVMTTVPDATMALEGLKASGFETVTMFEYDGEMIEVVGQNPDPNRFSAFFWLPSPQNDGFVAVTLQTRLQNQDDGVECGTEVEAAQTLFFDNITPNADTTFPN